LTLALDEGDWSALCLYRFTVLGISGWVGSRAALSAVEQRNVAHAENRAPAFQPVAVGIPAASG
jgi:hypothetical protein